MQVALCRGAATAQKKDWGVIVTHSPASLMESGPKLYDDLVFSYNSGAKYAVVFDYADTNSYPKEQYQPYEYGILTDEHFDALKNFWNYTQNNPGKHGSLKADVALVLPQAYGFGLRNAQDNVWGIFNGDTWSQILWSDVNGYLGKYGSKIDIVYDDPSFNNAVKSTYSKVIHWTSGNASANFPVKDLDTTFGYPTIQDAINSGATSDGDVISVKPGVYHENLVVNKTLSIIGQNKATTIIDGCNSGTSVKITNSNVTLSSFTIRNSGENSSAGIYLDNVGNCSIVDNTVSDNYYGIYMNCSGNNTLRSNAMNGNTYNLGIDGNEAAHFINNVDSSNTINGKKVYYLVGNSNLNIKPSTYPHMGYLALVNCKGITVQNLNLSNNGNGILLVNTQNSTLIGNKIVNSIEGLRLMNSEGNILRNNSLTGNKYNFLVQGGLLNYVDASNTLNGKPIYYWIGQNNKAVPSNAGYVALINCSGVTVQNLDLASNWQSIVLSSSTNSTVSNNQINSNYCGIELENSSNSNSIRENTVVNCTQGITLSDCKNNNIANNVLSNNQFGGYFTSSSFNTISENTVNTNIDHGMQFTLNCNNNTLIGNSINRNNVAVEFTNSSGETIIQNSLTGNTQSIQIHGQSNGTSVAQNYITNTTCGIEIDFNDAFFNSLVYQDFSFFPPGIDGSYSMYHLSSSHVITQNTLTNNTWGIIVNSVNNTYIADNSIAGSKYGIELGTGFSGTQNNTLSKNTVTNSTMGLSLNYASNCSIIKNTISFGEVGITISESQNNSLIGNTVSNNTQLGIQLSSSSTGNTLRDNNLVGNKYGFDDESVYYGTINENVIIDSQIQSKPQYYTNDVDASNTVNAKPIIYWVGQSDKTVPSNTADVILVNCTNITVQNLTLTGNSVGVLLAHANNCTVTDNTLQGNSIGIRLLSSSYNALSQNNLIGNDEGMTLDQAVWNLYPDPTSNTNIVWPTSLVTLPSTGNMIIGNTIESNSKGISLGFNSGGSESSSIISGNTFYFNSFINNKNQVTAIGEPSPQNSSQLIMGENSWDNSAKGNYWSDYNGTDTNHDGIGDTSYLVYANNTDHYPVMTPF